MSSRSRATHTTRAPSLRLRRPQRVIRHDRAFFAWRSATRLEHCTAWPDDAGLPFSLVVVVRRRSWGSSAPFAGLIPLSGGLITLASHDARSPKHTVALRASRRHFCRSGPTCRSCLPRPPRLIFVGVTDRLLDKHDLQKRSAGDVDGVDFWALTPVCGPPPRRTFGRRRDPAMGFASCRVVGHSPCIGRARPRLPITSLRNIHAPLVADARSFLSAHGLCATILPITRDSRLTGSCSRPRRADLRVIAKD
jgi:hypothetical protein